MRTVSRQLTLPDGRKLDYQIAGADDGFPLVWIHGTPGSRKETLPSLLTVGAAKGFKIISSSRAGYGDSSRHAVKTIVDSVADTRDLLEHLGVKECVVGGWSGGGPHALACAARLPGCKAALCVAGVGPYGQPDLDFLTGQGQENIDEFNAALAGEAELRKFLNASRAELLQLDAAGLVKEWSTILPDADKEAILEDKDFGQNIIEILHEALKHGVDGWADDDSQQLTPWGFDLSEIKVPVFVYHGTVDKMVPFAHGEWVAKHLPPEYVRKHLLDGHGHFSIFLDSIENMLDDLLQAATEQTQSIKRRKDSANDRH